ncbi:MAG: hypothetical protein JHD07_00240 [Bradyrhizobium sp.]|jgi:hypothetical protein|uniref:hypothetical protein n=1 Tax=Bradyrhizobium sp. TaxID=376 RepID=UPI001A19B200|nr:hypothetical protein [Bradyrhizobium sp.]MBJ7401806.1 hypothetical protein [Bradyrhizobium sp.]
MVVVLVVLGIWLLLNILFVVIVVPPRKPQQKTVSPGRALSAAPIDPSPGQFDHERPFSLRHAVASIAMGAFFVLVPPLLALRDAIVRLFRKSMHYDR